ncbi:MAG: efflux RND transporter periplasmic adaptor subunit [Hyphomicrobiales bacterium]|nr:efflux RND transporter periplasmic adaptor subunit [Hyphomicrobiales bacterium]MDE2116043.1 efflux RND transporter periplasmic adaptor subunit [Hyphomicrobiales bacterium]
MSRNRLILVVAVLIAAGATAILIWKQVLSPTRVDVAHMESNVPVDVFGLGTVEARVTSKVGFKVSGLLVELHADVGDKIAKGTVLARIDSREQTAQVARTNAGIALAQANLQRAMASVDKANANYTNSKSINTRRQALVANKITSVETAQSAQAAQDAALGDLNLAKSDVLVAQANIADAKAQSQLQSATLDFYTLTAPYDAMVTARLKELGSAIGSGEPVYTLIDPNSVWALAYIDESRAGHIKVGEPAQIVLRSLSHQRLAGKVIRIEPESDRVNEERRIEIAFDAIPANANLGEQAEVYVTTRHLPKALLVPEAAILGLSKTGGEVWTLEDGRLQKRKVTLGDRLLDGRFEITSDLPDHAEVLTKLPGGLRIGRAAIASGS